MSYTATIPDPSITAEVLPSGGVVALTLYSLAQTGTWTLTRAISGTSLPATTVYSGPPLSPAATPGQTVSWVDAGDGTALPLDPTKTYTWTFTTASGSITTSVVSPACTITIQPDQITDLITRVMKAGVSSLYIPAGFQNKPSVIHAMPLNGQPSLPLITINEDLLQQENIGIGDSVNTSLTNNYVDSAMVKRRFSVTVLAMSVEERKFYRDAVISIFRTMAGPALERLGSDIKHSFQAADSQVTDRDQSPGFYYSTIMLDVSGMFNVGVTTSFPSDAAIDTSQVQTSLDADSYATSRMVSPAAI